MSAKKIILWVVGGVVGGVVVLLILITTIGVIGVSSQPGGWDAEFQRQEDARAAHEAERVAEETAAPPVETEPEPEQEPAPLPDAPIYPEYEDVDPYTSMFFIALEDDGSNPTTYLGGIEDTAVERKFLWNMGVMFCEDLDDGKDVGAALEFLAGNSNMGDASGSIAAAAVLDICSDHRAAVQSWVDDNT